MIVPQIAYNDRVLQGLAYDNAAWTKTNVTVTANSTVAPDGTTTGDTLSDADAVNLGTVAQAFTVPNDSLTRMVAVYFKAGTAPVCGIKAALSGGTGVTAAVAFNPTTGQLSASNQGSAPASAGVTSLASGWFRVTFPITNNSTGNVTLTVTIYPAFAAALAGSGLSFTTNAVASQTGTVIAWRTSCKDSFAPTWPPVNKDLADERDVTRHDSTTSSGILQIVYERTDVFKNLSFAFVPAADMPIWSTFVAFAEQGQAFTYYPDNTDWSTSADWQFAMDVWRPQRATFGFAKFDLRIRQVV